MFSPVISLSSQRLCNPFVRVGHINCLVLARKMFYGEVYAVPLCDNGSKKNVLWSQRFQTRSLREGGSFSTRFIDIELSFHRVRVLYLSCPFVGLLKASYAEKYRIVLSWLNQKTFIFILTSCVFSLFFLNASSHLCVCSIFSFVVWSVCKSKHIRG